MTKGVLGLKFKTSPLPAGLYLVATPIGTARDITLRALDVLASADILVAEDTRTLRKLMDIHGIDLQGRPMIPYHDHSSASDRNRIIALITEGKSVAYASEAGTPLIADPGFKLVTDAQSNDLSVTTAPGPSAVITALTLAGLPTDRFLFAGFLPNQQKARVEQLSTLLKTQTTLVLYESPKRILALCTDIKDQTGPDHPVTLCRELTKRFEDIRPRPVSKLIEELESTSVKGEVVLVIGPVSQSGASDGDLDTALRKALLTMRVKDAAETVAGAFGLPKREVYQRALTLKDASHDETQPSDTSKTRRD